MRFLIDECIGPIVARWLREQGHDVFSVYEHAPGIDDDEIIEKALIENRILVTNDKDFREKIFRDREPHKGVILLRLDDERVNSKTGVIQRLLENYSDKLQDNFIVVTEKRVRIVKK